MPRYDVWLEGYAATGEHATAQCLQRGVVADSFPEACVIAMENKDWDRSAYDPKTNTFWACHFFEEESNARASFG